MASDKQVELFARLTEDREFPLGTDLAALRNEFSTISPKSASAWIEKALTLPEKGEVPPSF